MTHSRFTRLIQPSFSTLVLALALASGNALATAQQATTSNDREVDQQLRYALNVSAAFQEVTRSIGPAVVNITTSAEVQQRRQSTPFGRDPFDEFFERFFEGAPPQFRQQRQPQELPPQIRRGQGSGVIVSTDGYIVTNYHVIAQADTITVQLTDGDEYEATVVGSDPETDLAVLRIEANGSLVAAEFGDSDSLQAGEWVLAVGNPFGFQHTVTAGIISATGRQLGIIRDRQGYVGYEDFIQTDAAINPGNSGGPLVNLHGEVIGINSAIASQTGGYMGLGFAIPASIAEPVVQSIIEHGSVTRGYIGITMNPLTEELAESLDYDSTDGAVVADVVPDGPADQAEVQPGDIITNINGEAIQEMRDISEIIANLNPGTEVELGIVRNGRSMTLPVTLGTRPTAEERLAASGRGGESSGNELGVTVSEVTPQIARQLGMRQARGVIIREIDPSSLAGQAGLQPNDVILTIDNTEIHSVEDYEQAMADADLAEGVRLRIARRGMVTFYVLRRG